MKTQKQEETSGLLTSKNRAGSLSSFDNSRLSQTDIETDVLSDFSDLQNIDKRKLYEGKRRLCSCYNFFRCSCLIFFLFISLNIIGYFVDKEKFEETYKKVYGSLPFATNSEVTISTFAELNELKLKLRNYGEFPGFSELYKIDDGNYLSQLTSLYTEKHQEQKKANDNLEAKHISHHEEFRWDDIHISDCQRINEKYYPQILSLSNKNQMEFSDLLIRNWSTISFEKKFEKMTPILKKTFFVDEFQFDPLTVKNMLQLLREEIIKYYEIENEEQFTKLFDTLSPNVNTEEFQKYNSKFGKLILSKILNKKDLVFAFLGSSVFSGQDNCWNYSYPKQFERIFQKIFSIFPHTNIIARPGGQNGDGAAVHQQFKCAVSNFGEFDVIQTGLWMIPVDSQDHASFLEEMFLQGRLVHALAEVNFLTERSRPKWYENGGMEFLGGWADGYDLEEHIFPWWPRARDGQHWGRQGDGRCHVYNREGADGTYMQNWHPGALGFQMMLDKIIYYYSFGIEEAMDLIIEEMDEQKEKFNIEQLKRKVHWQRKRAKVTCASGFQPRYTDDEKNFGSWVESGGLLESEDEFRLRKKRIENPNWFFQKIKGQSNLGQCRDPSFRANNSVYKSRSECTSHPDLGYGWVSNNEKMIKDWLVLNLPQISARSMFLCTTTHSRKMSIFDLKLKLNGQKISILEPKERESKTNPCVEVKVNMEHKIKYTLQLQYPEKEKKFEISWIYFEL
eukprot:maker-scaffold_23-snap-gene-4.53-mRNA-1 protein AED:0.29 eAED:0.29 QI:0/0.66/0.5/0.75/1/1/4/549/732